MVRYFSHGALLVTLCGRIRQSWSAVHWRREEYGASLQIARYLAVGLSSFKRSKSSLHFDRHALEGRCCTNLHGAIKGPFRAGSANNGSGPESAHVAPKSAPTPRHALNLHLGVLIHHRGASAPLAPPSGRRRHPDVRQQRSPCVWLSGGSRLALRAHTSRSPGSG
jgi:hypothetical protein